MTTDDLLSRKMFTRNLHIPRQEVIPNNGLAPDDDTTYRNNPKSQTITSCEHDVALTSLLALLILAIVGTGLAYLVNYQLIHTTWPVAASVVSYLIPVVAVVFWYVALV